MRLRTERRVIYVGMGLTVLALIGGFAVASLSLGNTNTAQQGSQTTTISQVTGLSWTSTTLVELGASVTNTTCSNLAPCAVTSAPAIDCAGGSGGCVGGDFVEQVVLNTTTGHPFSGTVKITMYVTIAGLTSTGTTFYYTDGAGNTLQTITQDFDVGTVSSGPAAVSSVSVVANV